MAVEGCAEVIQGTDEEVEEETIEVEEDKPAKKDDAEQEKPRWLVGFEQETFRAFRVPADNDTAPLEYTNIFGTPPDEDLEPCTAIWPDGFRHKIVDVTAAQYRSRQEALQQKRKKTKDARKEEYHNYELSIKRDRHALAWLRVKGSKKQICQVRIDQVPSEDYAFDILKKVVDGIESGKDPYAVRNALLEEVGIVPSKGMAKDTKPSKDTKQGHGEDNEPKRQKRLAGSSAMALVNTSTMSNDALLHVQSLVDMECDMRSLYSP